MRHILINIILLFTVVLGYGQMQQVLKNGFVAATDSGVFYLQNGFSEWVRLGTPARGNTGSFEKMDTVVGVSQNSCSLFSYDLEVVEGSPQQYSYDGFLYGGSLFSFNIGGSYTGYVLQEKNIINLNIFGEGTISCHTTPSSGYILIEPDRKLFSDYTFNGSWISEFTGFEIDTDTTVCFGGTNNTLYKIIAAEIEGNASATSISGLHSRSTDSHVITYNPDNDEFIIVSDSGIVYTYDKTTLTTVDTLANCTKVDDIAYGGGYVYVIARSNANTDADCHISSNLTSWIIEPMYSTIDLTYILSCAYSTAIDQIYIYGNNGSGSVPGLFIDNAGNKVTEIVGLNALGIIPFDLDYINYKP